MNYLNMHDIVTILNLKIYKDLYFIKQLFMIESKQKTRKDKLKNKAKVIKEILKDPTLTQEDIQKKTWLWLGTVNRNMQELEKNGKNIESKVIDNICWNDRELLNIMAWVNLIKTKELIKYDEEDQTVDVTGLELNDLKSLNDITEKSFRRYTLFKWDITDDQGWMKNSEIDNKSLEELVSYLNKKINSK